MNERISRGNTHRASTGLTNGSAASGSRGMTNGLGGRTNGMTNGLGGRTNGLTNGLGGRTNGMTNGLGRTNGLTNGLGKTNGLTNGLGPGGPVMRSRRMDNSAISPFRISLIIVIAFVLLVPASFLLVSQNEAEYSGIRVDADFSDWDDITLFTDPEQYATPGLDIANYAVGTNDAGGLFLYASARANWFSASEADSLMVFIDSDGNPATGYSVRGLGADYLAEVYGWDNAIQGRQLGIFSGQDQLNWSAWNWRSISAALGTTQVEMGVQASVMQLQPTHSMLFLTKRGDSVADVCDAAIGLDRGALVVKQVPVSQTGIVATDSLMTLELTAVGSAVEVSAIDFAYSGLSAPTVSSLDQGAVTVQPGTPVTLTVTSSVSGLNSGTFLSLEATVVTGTGVPSITGDKLSAYAHAAPGSIRVDGAFADWTGVNKTSDTDAAANPSIDIANHASTNSSVEAFFYIGLAANGRMFGGSTVPVARSVPGEPGEPGEPGTPTPLPKVSGEDVTRIYINTKSGGQITYGIQADYMIEIKGREGEITSKRMYSLPSRTFLMGIDAACNAGQLVAGVALDEIDFTGTFAYVMESTDWQANIDRTAPAGLAAVVTGTRGGTPAWGLSGITVSDKMDVDETLDGAPQPIPDGTGGAIIAWYENSPLTGWDIYAQRIDSMGVPMWGAGATVCNAANNQEDLQIVSDGLGGAIFAWTDYRWSTSYPDIYALRLDSTGGIPLGSIWGANGNPVCQDPDRQRYPQVVPDGLGGAVIGWEDWRNFGGAGGIDIYAQSISAYGSLGWGADWPVCGDPDDQFYPCASPNGLGGAIFAWEDWTGGTADVFAQSVVSSPMGWGMNLWATSMPVCNRPTDDQRYPRAIQDGSGGAAITWQDSRDSLTRIFAQRIDSDGGITWPADAELVPGAYEYRAVPDGNGGIIAAWDDYADIWAQRVDGAGTVAWAPGGTGICLDGDDKYAPDLVPDGQGGALIVWEDWRTPDPLTYAQRVSKNGVCLWDSGGAMVSDGYYQENPRITLDSDWLSGNQAQQPSWGPATANEAKGAIVVWQDWRNWLIDNRYGTGIFAQSLDEDKAEFVEEYYLDPNFTDKLLAAGDMQNPAVVTDSDGIWVAWEDWTLVPVQIIVNRWNWGGWPQWPLWPGGQPIPIGNGAGGLQGNQKAPVLVAKGGGVILIWEDDRDSDAPTTGIDLYGRSIHDDGTLGGERGVCCGPGDARGAHAVPDGQGGACAAWEDTRADPEGDIRGARLDSSCDLSGPDSEICTAPGRQGSICLTPDSRGGCHCVWEDERLGPAECDIHTAHMFSDGMVLSGGAVCDAPGEQRRPCSCSDGDGGAWVAWEDHRPTAYGESDIHGRHLDDEGMPRGASDFPICVDTEKYARQSNPDITPDGRGGFHGAWEDERDSTPAEPCDIWGRRMRGHHDPDFPPDPLPEEKVNEGGHGACDGPRCEPDGDGGTGVVWRDDEGIKFRDMDKDFKPTDDELPISIVPGGKTKPQFHPHPHGGGGIAIWIFYGTNPGIYGGSVILNQNTIVINEVMFDHAADDDWVEIYNPSGVSYDISGWTLVDGSDAVIHTFPASTTLAANDYLVVTVGTALDGTDALALMDTGGAMRDYLAWGGAPSGTYYSLALSSENWLSGTYVDTTGFVQGDTLGRDSNSTDTNTVPDWEITCGIDADSPTPDDVNDIPEFGRIMLLIIFSAIPAIAFWARRRRSHD